MSNDLSLSEIHLRDPFVLPDPATRSYYLYGTEGASAWKGNPKAFFVYRSSDLERWEGPHTCFRAPEGFWPDRNYWAPEVHRWRGRFYLFASFHSESVGRGTQSLVAGHPEGPFTPLGNGPLTPREWECLDGTLFVDDGGVPWMVFCHEWVQVADGEIWAVRLNRELDGAADAPVRLFSASEAPWAMPIRGGNNWVTDGPFLYRLRSGGLLMLWSSFGRGGYTLGIARSESGGILGPWRQEPQPLYERDGGHGMLFRSFTGELLLAIHTPNDHPRERPIFVPVSEQDETLCVAPGRV